MAGKVVHVEIGAADTDRAQGFWSGVFGWEVGPPMSPEMDYRMFQSAEDQGGAIVATEQQGNITVYFDTRRHRRVARQGRGARRPGRRQGARARPRLVRRLQRHGGERVQPLAGGLSGQLSAGSGSDQSTAGGSSSRSTSSDGNGQPSLSFASACSLIRELERASRHRGYVSRRSTTRRAFPSLRGTLPGWTTSTRAGEPKDVVQLLAHGRSVDSPLHLDRELVEVTGAVDHELVVRRELGDREERTLDLAREDVDASDDQQVVGPPEHARHAGERAAAGARLARERGKVAGPVAQKRQRLLRQRREDELADLTVRQRLTGRRIDDLDQEVILVHVRAVPRLGAFGGDARPHHLREAVDVERRQRERALDGLAQPFGPRLGAEDARPEVQARRIGDMVGDRKRIARGAAEDLGAEILEQLRLARRVPARRRHDGAAEPLGAVVDAETAGEEAVAVRDVHTRARAGSGRRERPRAAVGPGREIAARVGDDRRLAARSRRGVDPHALLERHPQQAERIRVAQLRLDPERLLRQRLELDPEPLAAAARAAAARAPGAAASRARAGRSPRRRLSSPYKRRWNRPRRRRARKCHVNREGRNDLLEGMDTCFAERSTSGSWRM